MSRRWQACSWSEKLPSFARVFHRAGAIPSAISAKRRGMAASAARLAVNASFPALSSAGRDRLVLHIGCALLGKHGNRTVGRDPEPPLRQPREIRGRELEGGQGGVPHL